MHTVMAYDTKAYARAQRHVAVRCATGDRAKGQASTRCTTLEEGVLDESFAMIFNVVTAIGAHHNSAMHFATSPASISSRSIGPCLVLTLIQIFLNPALIKHLPGSRLCFTLSIAT